MTPLEHAPTEDNFGRPYFYAISNEFPEFGLFSGSEDQFVLLRGSPELLEVGTLLSWSEMDVLFDGELFRHFHLVSVPPGAVRAKVFHA